MNRHDLQALFEAWVTFGERLIDVVGGQPRDAEATPKLELGMWWETRLRELAVIRNMRVDDAEYHQQHDMVINLFRVQAKATASQSGSLDVRPRHSISIESQRRYAESDFDVLAVYLSHWDERYFIPVSEFRCAQVRGAVAPYFHRDQQRRWLEAWHVFQVQSDHQPLLWGVQ